MSIKNPLAINNGKQSWCCQPASRTPTAAYMTYRGRFSLMTRERMQMHAKYYLLYNNKDMLLFLSQLFSAKKLPLMEV